MRLKNCIFVDEISDNDRKNLELVLKTTKSVMVLTKSMPTIEWQLSDGKLFVFGSIEEINIVSLALNSALGLSPDDDIEEINDNPFDLAPISGAEPATVEEIVGLDDIFDNNIAWSEEEIAATEARYNEVNEDARNNLRMCNRNSNCNIGGDPDEEDRIIRARALSQLACDYINNSMVEPDIRQEWQTVFDRLESEPTPTESASGSYTAEEQIEYSEAHNPRHWNIVKVHYGHSRYYLSYICPPSVDMQTTLRVVGGIHACDRPNQFEICVYNTEPYWRELRHMMHREVTYLREVVPA